METVFQVLAQPRRVEILRLIKDEELTAGEIADRFDVTRPAISQHLRVLLEGGLISGRREGTKRLYRLRREGLEELGHFLQEFWSDRLAELKRQAESAHRDGRKRRRRR
jgi:DNA-binding transcriptional ArsR family regulator